MSWHDTILGGLLGCFCSKFKSYTRRMRVVPSSWPARVLSLFQGRIKKFSPVNWPRFNKIYIFDIINNHVIQYPTPACLTYA